LLTYRGGTVLGTIGGRDIYYKKSYKRMLEVTIFDGGHERLDDIALSLIEEGMDK
jgi:hypothetical protein